MNDYFDGEVQGSDLAILQSPSSVAVQMAQAELTQAVTTARAFPRSIKLAVDRIMSLATLDGETAAECIYAVPRDGKAIKGPSIRFAEIVASQYGNCNIGSRIVAVDRVEKVVIAEGVFWDLETGTKITKQIQRRISGKSGKIYSDDMITTTGNAAASIALREAILKGVPKAIWRKAYERADQVTLGKTETIVQRRHNAIAAFAAWGIVPEQIFASLEVGGLDDIGLEEISVLTAMFRGIKSGEQTVEAYFPPKVDAMAARNAAKGTARKASDDPALPGPKAAAEKQVEQTQDAPAVKEQAKAEPEEVAEKKPAAKTESRADVRYVEEAQTVQAKAEPEQASLLPEADEEQAKPAATEEPDWSKNGFGKGFLMDVRDMGFDAAADLHDQQLAQIKDEKPGLHAYLMAECAKLTNG